LNHWKELGIVIIKYDACDESEWRLWIALQALLSCLTINFKHEIAVSEIWIAYIQNAAFFQPAMILSDHSAQYRSLLQSF
jgi:hypothetical protein